MRKTFIIVMSLVIVMTLFQISNYTLIESKIVYEFSDGKQDLSTEDVEKYISGSGKVNIVTRFQYDNFKVKNNLPEDASMEEVDAYKKKVFELGKKYHKTLNEKYASTLDVVNYDSCYISEYTPYCEYTFNESEFVNNMDDILSKFSSNKNVQTVFVKQSNNFVEDKVYAGMDYTRSYQLVQDDYVSGSGVKIGMLETGLPDFTHQNLDSVTHTLHGNGTVHSVTEHATIMANIICGEKGVAYGAQLYCNGLYGNDIVAEADWFMNNGCDIVNMSFGEADPPGVYGADSALADYMVLAYDIIVCAAAGNDGQGDGYIGNPGMGYNVITVGAATYGGNWASFSSYEEGNYARKPTIIAPGSDLSIQNMSGTYTGTSAACAFTTGTISLLLNYHPILKTKALQVVAMVVACSGVNSSYGWGDVNGFNEYIGAGMLDFRRMYDEIYKTTSIHNVNPGTNIKLYEYSIYISSNRTIRACFTWPAYANPSNVYGTPVVTDYDVFIKDEDGNILHRTTSSTDNVEVATYTTTYKGTYYIQLYKVGNFPSGHTEDTIYFSYRYR